MMLGFTLKCKDGELHAQIRDRVVIYLIVAITTQRQTQQDVLAGQAAIKQIRLNRCSGSSL